MTKVLGTPDQLMKWLSEELADDDDRAHKYVINNSLVAKKLIEGGEDMLPIIGKYLFNLDPFLQRQHVSSREQVKKGWVVVIEKIIKNNKITQKKKIPGSFGNLRKWAAEYKKTEPSKF